jgi:hypothetical protein
MRGAMQTDRLDHSGIQTRQSLNDDHSQLCKGEEALSSPQVWWIAKNRTNRYSWNSDLAELATVAVSGKARRKAQPAQPEGAPGFCPRPFCLAPVRFVSSSLPCHFASCCLIFASGLGQELLASCTLHRGTQSPRHHAASQAAPAAARRQPFEITREESGVDCPARLAAGGGVSGDQARQGGTAHRQGRQPAGGAQADEQSGRR